MAKNFGHRNGRVSSEEMLEHQNQQMTENLGNKVSHLKSLAFDIENEAKDSNKYLSGMDSDFDSTTGLLTGSVNRLSNMISSGKNNRKLMCYMICGLVILFLALWYLFTLVKT